MHELIPFRPSRPDAASPAALPCQSRRLAAILMADVVGFAALVQDDERGTRAALHEARATMRALAARHCGRIVDTAGDSILAEFPSVVGAVLAATAFQSAIDGAAGALRFRIGIHLGDVIAEDDGSLFGEAVNVAARLQSRADPGGILVSRSVFEEVRGKLPIALRSRGRYSLRNIRGAVPCFAVVRPGDPATRWGGLAWPSGWRWPVPWRSVIPVGAVGVAALTVACIG